MANRYPCVPVCPELPVGRVEQQLTPTPKTDVIEC